MQPETRGKRGERCQARNDCDAGLACLNGLCAKNEFEIDVKAMHCDRVDCSTDVDCCGDRPTTAPTKCKDRDVICTQPTVSDCSPTACTSKSDTCGDGVCRTGTCSPSGIACMDSTECTEQCVAGFCSLTNLTCTVASNCPYYTGTCLGRTCNCANPVYDPTDPICTDPECTDICLLRCDNERCLKDNSCEVDQDCLVVGSTARLCDSGRCVQCKEDEDCDPDSDETCVEGRCDKPCQQDEECGMFEACDVDSGECVYRGCTSDRECVLAAARGGNEGVGGSGPILTTTDDPRLFKCLESDTDATIKICKIPCENDGSCGQFQVCDAGFCKFVGCETNEECRAYLGISNEMTSETKPYISTAVCRE
ncbi:MAG TPA: hypothetical protein VIW29_16325 [Polyangiaceae bacterium]